MNSYVNMATKYVKKEITRSEYYNWIAQQNGFKDQKEYNNWLLEQRGFANYKEYADYLAVKRGYKNRNEYSLTMLHKNGKCKPLSENKECAYYLGVHIAERILSKVFKNVERMPIKNIGYDFICNKGYKIDVKSACLHKNKWLFHICKNEIADHFLLLAFDNRNDLNPLHMWLINGDELISTRRTSVRLNKKVSLTIYDSKYGLSIYNNYEVIDKLDIVKRCCNSLKEI